MPSITYWSRLEPRPDAASFAEAIAARVRDPAWLLCRQWQLGEFRGEDAASPAFVTVNRRLGRLDSWQAQDGEPQPLTSAPLEAQALAEEFDATDLSVAAEIGAAFERPLLAAGRQDLVAQFRGSYAIQPLPGDARTRDPDAARFVDVLAGRRVHGIALLDAARAAAPDLPAPTPADAASQDTVRAALEAATELVASTLGSLGTQDAPSWRPERLDYSLELHGHAPTGAPVTLLTDAARDGRLDWHAFDVRPVNGPAASETPVDTRSLIPTLATFRGMPSPRFWAFEQGTFNVAAVRPGKHEIGKLLVLDYLLVHGVNWYSFPLRQPTGTLAAIESLIVRDVFGDTTAVPPVASGHGPDRWSLFTLSSPAADPVPWLFLSANAGAGVQLGDPAEEVRFFRDEMANLAWAIERTVIDPAGQPRSAHERAARTPATGSPVLPAADAALVYRIQTDVPANWLPLIPVAVQPGDPEIALERGILLRDAGTPPEPATRILRPTSLGTSTYRLAEDALPRTGLVVDRTAHRVRWVDGTTHVWLSRRSRRTRGQDTSGLRFDVLALVRGHS